MANSDQELAKMIKSFRVSDLQTLLVYSGRNKNGKKSELQFKALELIKLRSAAIDMKIREIHLNKFGSHSRVQTFENPDMYNPVIRANRSNIISHRNVVPSFIEDVYDSAFPRNPNVRFRELPLFEVLAELVRPTNIGKFSDSMLKENDHVFYLSQQQVNELTMCADIQVQLRMCLLDTTCEQDDEIPASICIKVNNVVAPNLPPIIQTNRPGAEPRRVRRPVDITGLIKKSTCDSNVISISLAAANGQKSYVVGCFLVKRVSSSYLISKLKQKGVMNPDHTTSIIKEKLLQEQDSEIASLINLKGSLVCPLGKQKMQLPTRASSCNHLQCFDGIFFIQMNEKKPKWICPVCDKPAYYKTLAIDGLFVDIISKAPKDCNEVLFHEDGSWTPIVAVKNPDGEATIDPTPKKPIPKVATPEVIIPEKPIEVIDLDSDDDTRDSYSCPPKKKVCKTRSPSSSPVLLASPEHSQKSRVKLEEAKTFNPFLPSTSKQEQACTVSPLSTMLEKSSLAPLPDSLDISSDVDCILGDVPSASGPGPSSSYENVTPAVSPGVYPPPKNPLVESPEPGSTRHFSNFDLFSLIQPNQEMNYNFPPATEGDASPDVIDLD